MSLPPPAPKAAEHPTIAPPLTPRAFSCQCGRPVFFRNSACLACGTALGYDPVQRQLLALQEVQAAPAPAQGASTAENAATAPAAEGWWRALGSAADAGVFRRCANLYTAAACNWLLGEADSQFQLDAPLCACCRLTRTLPDLTLDNGPLWWNRIELAKRRLVSSLMALQLPVLSKLNEDPQHGLVFDLLRAMPGGPPVVTGHLDGVITLDVEEADDARRELRRTTLGEPYRTLLGHLRHETGHYYWQRLVQDGPWLTAFREVFGDERIPYQQALSQHYSASPPPDWALNFVSAYASSHPWEDWAETWAHYLHLVDTLDTARSFGLDGERVELQYEPFGADTLWAPDEPGGAEFLRLINGWMQLTGVLNELSRSMGVPDFYPFVLSLNSVRKLHLVHRVISDAAGTPGGGALGPSACA